MPETQRPKGGYCCCTPLDEGGRVGQQEMFDCNQKSASGAHSFHRADSLIEHRRSNPKKHTLGGSILVWRRILSDSWPRRGVVTWLFKGFREGKVARASRWVLPSQTRAPRYLGGLTLHSPYDHKGTRLLYLKYQPESNYTAANIHKHDQSDQKLI